MSLVVPVRHRGGTPLAALLRGHSVEVLPRTADRVADFRAMFSPGTRVHVAHIAGTPVADMVRTAARLRAEGFAPMPHLPARVLPDRRTLCDLVAGYVDAGVRGVLVLGGSPGRPAGPFHCAMQLLETGLLDGFARVHVAGHPEGSRDIDPGGGEETAMAALRAKAAWAARSGTEMAIVTQFAFDADPVIAWEGRLRAAGIALPVHVGLAGPARLQTLIRYAVACGVGPSLQVLQRRARDVTHLLRPVAPTGVAQRLAEHAAAHPGSLFRGLHLFPLGGLEATAAWAREAG
ncbi:methylenetetrahydrofolate reductase [Rhodobaculum claviforme]|uniref:methylenetetrahydrofolate reductase (NADH) n=1 Tax=Rhodobaculum claviforme TaxID=1549854 RepID=A0A934TKN2_9RHOB|nr:methylenetetrahydrofolate reductase [Rhodobaculum claviforme]MBK5927905.1 5,10-methylenetetrahydrofolate reductase [Rhodobaculum claviforme]